MNEKKHLFFIDDLRIWAIGAVLLQHSATYYIEGSYGNIQVANIFKGITRWNILLFIFISGYLLLGREISIKKVFKKYIYRIIIVFCVWSGLYSALNFIMNKEGTVIIEKMKSLIGDFVVGGTNRLWYLVLLVGLYLCIPIISTWLRNSSENEQRYCLFILGIICSVLPTLNLVRPINTLLGLNFQRISLVFPGIYIFYFILGGILKSASQILKQYKIVIVSCGIFSTIIMGYIHYKLDQSTLDVNIVFNVFCVLALYSFYFERKGVMQSVKKNIGECVFGIYLIHTLIQYVFQYCGLENILFEFPVVGGILVYCIALFGVSYILIYYLRKTKIGRMIT